MGKCTDHYRRLGRRSCVELSYAQNIGVSHLERSPHASWGPSPRQDINWACCSYERTFWWGWVNFKLICASILIITEDTDEDEVYVAPKRSMAPTGHVARCGVVPIPLKGMLASHTPKTTRRGAAIRGKCLIIGKCDTHFSLFTLHIILFLFRWFSVVKCDCCSHSQELSPPHSCSCSHN